MINFILSFCIGIIIGLLILINLNLDNQEKILQELKETLNEGFNCNSINYDFDSSDRIKE